ARPQGGDAVGERRQTGVGDALFGGFLGEDGEVGKHRWSFLLLWVTDRETWSGSGAGSVLVAGAEVDVDPGQQREHVGLQERDEDLEGREGDDAEQRQRQERRVPLGGPQ